MKVKVCGMKEPDNIKDLLELPIDMIGFIFYNQSKRFIGKQKELQKWITKNPEYFGEVQKVGVFVNAELEVILNTVHDYQLDYVQLHGTESPEYCRELTGLWKASTLRKAKVIKAFQVDDEFDFTNTEAYAAFCSYFIFDTKGKDYGGNGITFNWEVLEKYQGVTPFLLSGGIDLGMEDEIRALQHPQIAGVDINSKFEKEPALKDITRINLFLQKLRA